MDGSRISGTSFLIKLDKWMKQDDVTYRFMLDGEIISNPFDTTQYLDGSYVLSCQVLDNPNNITVSNGSKIVVINNSDQPLQELTDLAIVSEDFVHKSNSLAWGRVDKVCKPDQCPAYPLDMQLDKHPIAKTDADRERLATEPIWFVEGLNHQPTPLWSNLPILMKNRDGDHFVKQWNPEGGHSGATPTAAQRYVEQAPAYDGVRGVGNLSPYSVLNPYYYSRLNSGQYGFVGVDKSGRVVTVDLTGEIRTILGPRSVAGSVGTDSDEHSVSIEDRLASGEKEIVGDLNGDRLVLPHDIWPCSSFPFEGIIADTGNNCVTEIDFEKQHLMRRWPLEGVTSVCDSYECQQNPDINIMWVAVNPEGLWAMRHTTAPKGTNKHPVAGGRDGTFTGHVPTLDKLADIPNAFWVRTYGERIFVITQDMGVYEYNVWTSEVTELVARQNKQTFAFASVDMNGTIGPKGRLYVGSAGTAGGSFGGSKTSLSWLDIDTLETGKLSRDKAINRVIYGNYTSLGDNMGHYMWGIAIHPELPKFLTVGISASSYFLWTGCLGELPPIDNKLSDAGQHEASYGVMDNHIGISMLMGKHLHGQLGLSCDMFRDFATYEDARDVIFEVLTPLLHESVADQEREDIAKLVFANRSRKHFPDGVSIPEPEPEPEPEPDPEPEPITLEATEVKGVSITICGGVPPYDVTVIDSKGASVSFQTVDK